MIVIGEQHNEESQCKVQNISKSLEILGGLMVGVSILFSLLTFGFVIAKQDAGKTLQPLILAIVLTQIAIMIWSSVVVFGKLHPQWCSVPVPTQNKILYQKCCYDNKTIS